MLIGRTLGDRYDVLAMLGAGGMGAVFRARDRELDEEIALKVIRADLARSPHVLARFRAEVKLARRVTHKNVARTFELGHDGEITFCTMELVDGESLRDRLDRDHCVPPAEAIAIARDLCAGLVAAHDAGVIHRDIKPANVLIASDGRVVLADFGIAVAAAAEGDTAGTLAYMAPEQAMGDPASPQGDVYAVGVVLYEMVTGEPAFGGDVTDIVLGKQDRPHVELVGFGPELAAVIAKATARERDNRVGSAAQLAQLLGALDHARPAAAPYEQASGLAIRNVVVLPPRMVAGNEHLASAVHEAVLARISRIPRVRALPRTSAVGEHATAVVELDARHGLHATVGGPAGAPVVLVLPLSVAQLDAAANAIAATVASALDEPPAAVTPQAADAIDLLLRCRDRLQRDFTQTDQVVADLERARAMLPHDPRITATLAFVEARRAFFFANASTERLAHARALAREALAAGGDRLETHLALGHIELNAGNTVRAARHFRHAIACAPHAAEGHAELGKMLLEAGFIEAGAKQLEDAIAIAPQYANARWELARAWALEGDLDACNHLAGQLIAMGIDRWVLRLRVAAWRRDTAAIERCLGETFPQAGMPLRIAHMMRIALAGEWYAHRESIVASVVETVTGSARRKQIDAQIVAEAAGYAGDAVTCADMIARAAAAGAYDFHWVERCPLLDVARGHFADARTTVRGRAVAILDAMYGDADAERTPPALT